MSKSPSVSGLLADCEAIGTHDPDYYDKMMHPIPTFGVVDRNKYILDKCRDKVVLDVGASGPMHDQIKGVAKDVYGIDRDATPSDHYWNMDLDRCMLLPQILPDIVICGEVIEHLGNPLNFLCLLRKTYPCKVVVTTPNAFGEAGMWHVEFKKRENVNKDHVAYYSYHTLKHLLSKAGYTIEEFYWYGGPPRLSEGMIALVKGGT